MTDTQIADELAAIDARLRAVPTQLECSAAVNDLLQFMDRNAARILDALRSPEPAQADQVTHWQDFAESPPEAGERIVIVCDDGCSSSLALMTEAGPIDGEDAWELSADFVRGAIWFPLPVAYPLAFMERHDDY